SSRVEIATHQTVTVATVIKIPHPVRPPISEPHHCHPIECSMSGHTRCHAQCGRRRYLTGIKFCFTHHCPSDLRLTLQKAVIEAKEFLLFTSPVVEFFNRSSPSPTHRLRLGRVVD